MFSFILLAKNLQLGLQFLCRDVRNPFTERQHDATVIDILLADRGNVFSAPSGDLGDLFIGQARARDGSRSCRVR
jgi:hypothetical protein